MTALPSAPSSRARWRASAPAPLIASGCWTGPRRRCRPQHGRRSPQDGQLRCRRPALLGSHLAGARLHCGGCGQGLLSAGAGPPRAAEIRGGACTFGRDARIAAVTRVAVVHADTCGT
eukprot:scaffold3720_cov401-Prasinococcus_capsulatus_cf.AAC.2